MGSEWKLEAGVEPRRPSASGSGGGTRVKGVDKQLDCGVGRASRGALTSGACLQGGPD